MFVLKQVEHHLAVGGVKVARRLVGDEERGIQDERPRDRHPLLFAARKHVDVHLQKLFDAERLHHIIEIARARPRIQRGQQDVLFTRQRRHEVIRLIDKPELGKAQLMIVLPRDDLFAVESISAAVETLQEP